MDNSEMPTALIVIVGAVLTGVIAFAGSIVAAILAASMLIQ